MDSMPKNVVEMHRLNGGEEMTEEDTVRKQLSKSLEEYENHPSLWLMKVHKIAENPEGPGGCLQACPACWSLTGNDYRIDHHKMKENVTYT